MKLVLLYGPPGVGKLTVATELSKITGYDIFHNHLTADVAASIFPFGTQEYSNLVEKLRIDLIEAAASAGKKGLIFTFVYGIETYGGRADDIFIKKIIDSVKSQNGDVIFVKLVCDSDELHRRLIKPSRKKFRKLTSVQKLADIRKKYDLDSTIPFKASLEIDNTHKSAAEVAQTIKNHYNL